MTTPITAYTDTDAVRAAVALTDNEITDPMLLDQHMDLELLSDLATWLPDHATLFSTGTGNGATAAQQLIATHIKLYAQWFVACLLVDTMRLGVPQQMGDGKADMRRFSNVDFDILAARAAGRRDIYRSRLTEAQGGVAVGGDVGAARAVPAYDPVSNL